jgi:uncharacterized protein (DUF1330 family)
MKANYKIAAVLIGSFVLGAGAASVPHAQGTAPYYVIGEIQVQNEDGYKNDFLKVVQPKIKEAGAVYVAGGFNKAKAWTGSPAANRYVVLKFESQEAAEKWWKVAEKDQREIGNKYADFRIIGVPGVEQK